MEYIHFTRQEHGFAGHMAVPDRIPVEIILSAVDYLKEKSVHVPCVASVYFYKHLLLSGDTGALEKTIKFGAYFLLPGMMLFLVFFITLIAVQISAFAKGKTPYPKWCWIFSLAFGVLAVLLAKAAGNNAFFNGLSTAWISIGDIWMTGGLLLTMNKAKRMESK